MLEPIPGWPSVSARRRQIQAAARNEEDRARLDAEKGDLEIVRLRLENEKLAGEVAQQPQEAEERAARIAESESRTFRNWAVVLVPCLIYATSAVSSALGSAGPIPSDYELFGVKISIAQSPVDGPIIPLR